MKIQWETQLLAMPAVDENEYRLGRIAAAYCTRDTVVWFVLRLPGLRRRWRAVPGEGAHWNTAARTAVWLPYRRALVLASPVVDADSLDSDSCRNELEAYYRRAAVYPPRKA